ncbi:MAG: hypothetical protein D6712_19540 [Chloroflexi bacterium]|nr:MAG: hypothetical protein D6712_19540 [Chloroflexota bacterium]
MRFRFTVLVVVIGLLSGLVIGVAAQEDDTDAPRTYTAYVPTWYRGGNPLPLVVVLHGAGGNGLSMAQLTGFEEFAETEGFLVLYPDGLNLVWNDGQMGEPEPDDVGFLSGFIKGLIAAGEADPERIYVVGFSNGGSMTYRLACETPDIITAVAVVGMAMPNMWVENCGDGDPMPILIMHGTNDQVVPFEGRYNGLSPAAAAAHWADYNGCDEGRRVVLMPDIAEDRTRVRHTSYQGCPENGAVEFYEIIGGGHTWPSQRENLAYGRVSYDIDATEVIWRFFAQFGEQTEN